MIKNESLYFLLHCGTKIAPFLFLQYLCQTTLYFDNFWHTDTEVNLQQNCNKISHLS